MEIYCVTCEKNTANGNSSEEELNKQINTCIKWCFCDKKKSRFIKYQEASRIELNSSIHQLF